MTNHGATSVATERPRRAVVKHRVARRADMDLSLTEIVAAIGDGDQSAWSLLVDRLIGPIRASLATFNVDGEQRNDAAADTWRTLFERLETVQDPESLPRWVAVVARRKMIDIIRRAGPGGPMADIDAHPDVAASSDPDLVVEAETSAVLRAAVSRLSPREQEVVHGRVYTAAPESLKSLSVKLHMPSGSIGPTLGRSLAKLRRDRELVRFLSEVDSRSAEPACHLPMAV